MTEHIALKTPNIYHLAFNRRKSAKQKYFYVYVHFIDSVTDFYFSIVRVFVVSVVLAFVYVYLIMTVNPTFFWFIFQPNILFHANISIDFTSSEQLVTCHFT